MKKIILLFTFLLFANKAAAITYETLNINMPMLQGSAREPHPKSGIKK